MPSRSTRPARTRGSPGSCRSRSPTRWRSPRATSRSRPRPTETGPDVHLAIVDATADALLGAISRHGGDGHRAAFGYWLAPEARGRGVATRALRLLVDWTLATTQVIRFELYTDPDNDASGRVALRAGFEREGVRRAWDLDRDGRPDRLDLLRAGQAGRMTDHDDRELVDRRMTALRLPLASPRLAVARGRGRLARGGAVAGLRSGQVVGRQADGRLGDRCGDRSRLRRRRHPAHARPPADLALRHARGHPMAAGHHGTAGSRRSARSCIGPPASMTMSAVGRTRSSRRRSRVADT